MVCWIFNKFVCLFSRTFSCLFPFFSLAANFSSTFVPFFSLAKAIIKRKPKKQIQRREDEVIHFHKITFSIERTEEEEF